MTFALVLVGWLLAAALALRAAQLSRRLELVARAEHELRGPVSALALSVEALDRAPELRRRAAALEAHLDRLRLGLADLDAARTGRRATARPDEQSLEGVARAVTQAWEPAARDAGAEISFRWDAGPVLARADRARLSQALGNVLANAVEHGGERIAVSGERDGDAVSITVRDRSDRASRDGTYPRSGAVATAPARRTHSRGRGLAIAADGLHEMGGSLEAPDLAGGARRRGRLLRGTGARPPGAKAAGSGHRQDLEGTEVRIELPLVAAPEPPERA